MYFVIIGDIVDSKKIDNRSELQRRFNAILKGVNETYREEIASKFIITLGDEFQGVLRCGARLMEIIDAIEFQLYPVAVRFGIGIGEITTEINAEMAIGADGPAYYNARKMVEEIKEDEKSKMPQGFSVKLCSSLASEDETLNTVFSLCTFMKSKWTQRQREIIFDHLLYGDNQRKMAQRLGITQSSVQRSLSASGYYTYKKAREYASRVLSEKWGPS